MKCVPGVIWFLLGSVLLLAAVYQIKTVKVLPIESYPARISKGGVAIAADPYSTDEKSFSAFDVKDLNSRGYFPIHIVIKNDSRMSLTFHSLQVTLITADGRQLFTTPASVLVEDVFKSGKLKKTKSGKKSAAAQTGSPLSDFTTKEITNKNIDPGSISDGFLFFFDTTSKQNLFKESSLLIPNLEEEGTRKTLGPFSIPLGPAFSPSK
jgi:hypothetical protein